MTGDSGRMARWLPPLIGAAGYLFLVSVEPWWETFLRMLFPSEPTVLYARATLLHLVVRHLFLVGLSSGAATLLGLVAGICVTRSGGRDFLPVIDDVTSIGQTFPPVAVLALAAPIMGFGFWPAVFALFLYGLMPVLRNTTVGIRSVPGEVLEAARGMGMSPLQILVHVELPLALKVIVSGVRMSVVIGVGTATIGAAIGAGGLGAPIISGLISDNPALVMEGAVAAALLAIVADSLLGAFERSLSAP